MGLRNNAWLTVSMLMATVIALPAAAAEIGPDQKFTVMGSASCANWPKSGRVTSAAKAVPLNWVMGFLGGRALEKNVALLDLVNPDEIDRWLTGYCASHLTNGLPAAAIALAEALEAKLPPPPPPPGPPEPPMFVPPAPTPAKPAPAAKVPAKPRAPRR